MAVDCWVWVTGQTVMELGFGRQWSWVGHGIFYEMGTWVWSWYFRFRPLKMKLTPFGLRWINWPCEVI